VPVAPVRAPLPPPPRPRPPRRRRRFGAPVGDADAPVTDVDASGDTGSDVVVARDRGVESLVPVSGLGVVSVLAVVRGVDERAGRGRGVVGTALTSPTAPTGSRSADGGPSWVLAPAMPPVPEPFLLRPRPPRLRRRRGAPVPVEVPAPSDDGAAVASPSPEEDPVVRGASSERRRSALVVAASSAAMGLSWLIR